jgi:hypothetical protein
MVKILRLREISPTWKRLVFLQLIVFEPYYVRNFSIICIFDIVSTSAYLNLILYYCK